MSPRPYDATGTCYVNWCTGVAGHSGACPTHDRFPVAHSLETRTQWATRIRSRWRSGKHDEPADDALPFDGAEEGTR